MPNNAKIIKRAEESAAQSFLEQSELEQTAAIGISGAPQLRRWERSQFLGQFPEQVLWVATEDVLKLRPVPEELSAALADSRCCHVFVKAAQVQQARNILQAAKDKNLPVTVVHSPEYNNDVALVITTTEPQNKKATFIEPRG